MREGPSLKISSLRLSGITPAYAGRTREFRADASQVWDHPRLCGKD